MSGTYPTYDQLAGSQRSARLPVGWSRSLNGTQLGIMMGDRTRYEWRLLHHCTQAQFDTLVSLYTTNEVSTGAGSTTFIFEDDGQDEPTSPKTQRDCRFLQRPRILERIKPNLFLVETRFSEDD